VDRKSFGQVHVGGGEWPLSLTVVEQKEESLSKHHDLSRGWLAVNPSKSSCSYSWVETGTLLISCFIIWFLDKYSLPVF
jgi:hypothetical protein